MDKKRGIVIIFLIGIILLGLFFIRAQNEMIVSANFVGYGPETIISIQVPDYIDLGNISRDNPWNESEKFRVNNTGNIDFNITISISENSSKVFDYLYIKKYGDSTRKNISDFEITIPKKDDRTIYVGINLTNFNGTLPSNNIHLNATIRFVGMAA